MSVEWHYWSLNKRKRIPIAQAKLDNPVKLATRRGQAKQKKHNTIYVESHYTQASKNKVNKT